MRVIRLIFLMILTACANSFVPNNQQIDALRIIQYRDANGMGLMPVARSAGDAREKLWLKWLNIYDKKFDNQLNQKLDGQTQWCVQWLNGKKNERICRRDGGLIWFERGMLRDQMAVQMADRIWALQRSN